MIRVLLVDDQKTIREWLRVVVEPDPELEVVGTASDGQTAIEQVELLLPDIVLLDMEMPGLDSLQAIQAICQQFKQVKVIALLVHDGDPSIAKAIRAGAMGYLLKNTPPPSLREAIRFVHKGYAKLGPGVFEKVMPMAYAASGDASSSAADSRVAWEQSAGQNGHLPSLDSTLEVDGSGQFAIPNLVPTEDNLRPAQGVRLPLHWKWYGLMGLLSIGFIWTVGLLYITFKRPTFTSSWTIALPSSKVSTSVDLPDVGRATSQRDSPYSSSVSDPRENYKFLVETEAVSQLAASQMGLPLKTVKKPRIEIIDNTTLMRFSVTGDSPETAQDRAIAFQTALDQRLAQLREAEASQQNRSLGTALEDAKQKLQTAQQRLANYKARTGLGSGEQLTNLSQSIAQLRQQKSEITAQQLQLQANADRLSQDLGLSAQQATDAFALQSDKLFQQYLADYSQTSSELANLSAQFSAAHPEIMNKQAEKDQAQAKLTQQGNAILGRPFSLSILTSLNLDSGNSTSSRSSLFQELISLQARAQGLDAQVQGLDTQIQSLENRLAVLTQQGAQLEALERDAQRAEAVFSSTATEMDLTQANLSAAYPPIEVVAPPNIPDAPSAPKRKLALAGMVLSSLFMGLGLLALWCRNRQGLANRPASASLTLSK